MKESTSQKRVSFAEITPFVRHWLLLMVACCVWFAYESRYIRNAWFVLIVGLGLGAGIAWLVLGRFKPRGELLRLERTSTRGVFVVILLFSLAITAAFFTVNLHIMKYGSGRMLLAVGLAGLAALLLSAVSGKDNTYLDFARVLLILGVLHRVGAMLPEIQSGPFALGWSEGSRFYNASLFDARSIFGVDLPLPVLHPSRYLMQAIPFFLGVNTILAHRAWQVALWLGMTAWGAWLVTRKMKAGLQIPTFWLFLYCFLFFFQGAVYYHLMVCVVLMLIGYRKGSPWRTLIFVVLASAWAGISRVNWMPVPALLAVALYLLDEPFDGKHWLKYLGWPAAWSALGIAAAFAAKRGYVLISGEAPAMFDTAFSSALLWERLMPSATFFFGILPAILLACLPLGVLVWIKLRRGGLRQAHWLRWLGLAGIVLVMFAGGLVVSVKIGGGGDLHNLDALLVFWLLIGLSILADRLVPDTEPRQQGSQPAAVRNPFWAAVSVIVVVFFAFMRTGSWNFKPTDQSADLQEVRSAMEVLKDQPGEVLFISERQLLVFGELPGVGVVPEYEKVFLMEMAMGNNEGYLQEFYARLANHEFKAIISDPISTALQGGNRSFAAENNAWVEKVVIPMLNYYESARSWRNGEVNLLIPQGQPGLLEALQP